MYYSTRKHGRVFEIGSSGYLAKNLSVEDSDNFREYSEQDWHTFDEIIHSNQWSDINSLSNNWAAVYLASTPQQAANLGLNLPGVNEVQILTCVLNLSLFRFVHSYHPMFSYKICFPLNLSEFSCIISYFF